jgi:hypothetical protein
VRTKLRDAWAHAGTGAPSAESRERALIEGFLAKLSRQDVRLAELEQTIDSAAISIKPRLVSLRDSTVKDIEDGLALLEEMVAQLTLLRFEELAERAGEGGERDHVEGLLARIEAMASLTRAA